MTARPPPHLTRSALASMLDIMESTIDDMVRLGILKPRRSETGAVRFAWKDVEPLLASLRGVSDSPASDPYMAGARNVTKVAEDRRRDA